MKTRNKFNLRLFLAVLSASLLLSCTPQKRLNRLIERYPYLTVSDTIHTSDTFFFPEANFDTTFELIHLWDTVEIIKEGVEITLWRTQDTIYTEIQKTADTVIIERSVPVEKLVYKPEELSDGQKYWFVPWLLLALLFIVVTVAAVKSLLRR